MQSAPERGRILDQATMNGTYLIALSITLALFAYLLFALLWPERF